MAHYVSLSHGVRGELSIMSPDAAKGYTGHTMNILETSQDYDAKGRKVGQRNYWVAEGHTSRNRGEGTTIQRTLFIENAVKSKFPNSKTGDAGPGLRDYKSRDSKGNRIWPLIRPGGRRWNWRQFDKARRR